MPSAIWALLVSIEQYANPEWPHVKGAAQDAARVQVYFETKHGVPSDHIRVLADKQATRSEILKALREHLIDNPKIQKGDALVFWYSGHGSRSEAPEGWAVVRSGAAVRGEGEESDEEEEKVPMLEMIIPYDVSTLDEKGVPICGIPDRTLRVLLDLVASKHGENVTVVLDCCHSGHGTRKKNEEGEENPFQERALDPSQVTPLHADVDQDLWDLEKPLSVGLKRRPIGAAFTQRRAKSHVLLAACGQRETALGDDKGGLLTTYLLRALQNPAIRPRTYPEIMRHVNKDMDALRAKYPKFVKQHPQCEGIMRDRIVFEDEVADPRLFRVYAEGPKKCRVEAGEVQGIAVGTVFELYEMDESLKKGKTLGTAVASNTLSTYCMAGIEKDLHLETGHYYAASVLHPAYKLKYSVVNMTPNSAEASQIQELLETSLASATSEAAEVLYRTDPGEDDVELELEIDDTDGGGITLRRKDISLRDIVTHSPRIKAEEVKEADFPVILNAVARFNFYLAQASQVKPFTGEVDLEFHLLEPDPDYMDFDDKPVTKARTLQEEIIFKNDEAKIVEGTTDDYAFILHNNGPIPLFPHIVYFDTGTYQIETWYTPFEPEKPTLLPYSTLQIGASPEHSRPFTFFVREDDDVDTSFIKVFLLDAPVQMGFMDQSPVVGYDEDGKSFVGAGLRGASSTAEVGVKVPPRRGGWDSITRKITVTRQ